MLKVLPGLGRPTTDAAPVLTVEIEPDEVEFKIFFVATIQYGQQPQGWKYVTARDKDAALLKFWREIIEEYAESYLQCVCMQKILRVHPSLVSPSAADGSEGG